MLGQRASTLLRTPVLTRGIRLGEVENVLLDAEERRILGLEVRCGDGASRFLPFTTARRGDQGIEIDSTFTLLDPRELEFYRAHGRSLASVPELAEAWIEPDGALVIPLGAPLARDDRRRDSARSGRDLACPGRSRPG